LKFTISQPKDDSGLFTPQAQKYFAQVKMSGLTFMTPSRLHKQPDIELFCHDPAKSLYSPGFQTNQSYGVFTLLFTTLK
jgi:hypothetical protein